jgi:hypothetical protein
MDARNAGDAVVIAALKWIEQRTWVKVVVTILVVLTMPVWIVVVAVLFPFVAAYEEMWGDKKPRGWADG